MMNNTPLVVLSYFDPFGGGSSNNSEFVAKKILIDLKSVEIKLCPIPTIFDQAAHTLSQFVQKLELKPDFVISIGEGKFDLRFETMAHNLDHCPKLADNSGVIKENHQIIKDGVSKIGFKINLLKMYQGLEIDERKEVNLSTSPGKFVCNNTAYLFSHLHPELNYTFIHVPNHRSENNDEIISKSAKIIGHAILELVKDCSLSQPLTTIQKEVESLLSSSTLDIEKEMYSKWLGAFKPSDPLHGVTLQKILETLVDEFGWEELGQIISIRCFIYDPSIKSSLTFLRKTPWARKKVEDLYLSIS